MSTGQRSDRSRPVPVSDPGAIRRWISAAGLAAVGAVILVITLSPRPVDRGLRGTIDTVLAALHDRGVPEWFGYAQLEFTANILMFLPLGFWLALVLPRARQWWALVIVPVASAAIESAQLLFLAERYATLADVVANSIGGWIGALAAALLRALVLARDRLREARAAQPR